eukprot:TRINITY_DN17347_c1_g3_i1.p1 TRINITY_DN17347_c1_g3~~TRINITY_DN17347_c1_g3_i1.p1  ORF type:complete len:326 (-),score=61.48 TRINITY_DN17347_c1_g3_i1:274-1251(-)
MRRKMAKIGSELIFLGSGSSTATPRVACLVHQDIAPCRVCNLASQGDPRENPNNRLNPSIILRYDPENNVESQRFIQVDMGKTFREASCRWFPYHKIPTVHSVLLTHPHADHVFGLDDLRSIQTCKGGHRLVDKTEMFANQKSYDRIKECFPYLVRGPRPSKAKLEELKAKNPRKPVRHVSSIEWHIIDNHEQFETQGLTFTPLPVEHGSDLISLGFLFGKEQKVAYIPDVSKVLPETWEILNENSPLDLLITDAIFPKRKHSTHMNLVEAIDFARHLRPKKTLFVGMTDHMEHHETNAELKKLLETDGLDIQLAHDGLAIPLKL